MEDNKESVESIIEEENNKILESPEEILWVLTEPTNFERLHESFKHKSVKISENQSVLDGTSTIPEEGISKEEFLEIVNNVTNFDGLHDSLIIELFDQIDLNDTGRIIWDNFLDYNLKALQPKTTMLLHLGNVEYHTPKTIKRDSIVKIVLLETPLYFTYALLSKYGKIALYDGNFACLTSYMAIMSPKDQFRGERESRKRYRWLTDAVFMSDIHMFVVVNSTRSMTIYDASGLRHVAIWHISGFPNIIQTILYAPNLNQTDRKTLILGMDNGEIYLIKFLQPKDNLLKKKFQDKLSAFYYQELKYQKDYVIMKSLGKIHSEELISMQYLSNDKKTIISSSRDTINSLVIVDIDQLIITFSISSYHGIRCFANSEKHKIILTGTDKGIIKVWPYQKTIATTTTTLEEQSHENIYKQYLTGIKKPTKRLIRLKPNLARSNPTAIEVIKASKQGIVDLIILEQLNMFVCCSRDGELNFYNISDFKCVHKVKLQFNCFKIPGKTIEWSSRCIYPGPKRENMEYSFERNCILITCCNSYAKIDLFYMDGYERHLHNELLPPQPFQNSVLIPKDWEKIDYQLPTNNQQEEFMESSLIASKIHKYLDLDHEWLDQVLHKDFVNDLKLKEPSKIHSKVALLEERKAKMKWAVEHCAPFLALDLYNIEEIKLPSSLPIVDNKKTKSAVEKTHRLLKDASARSIIFSDLSSTKSSKTSSRSSRSSAYELE